MFSVNLNDKLYGICLQHQLYWKFIERSAFGGNRKVKKSENTEKTVLEE